MKRRLNDTRAIARSAAPENPLYENHSQSVRKISNGYIHSESHDGPDGYSSTETFHRNRPELNAGRQDRGSSRSDKLKRAAEFLKRD